MNTLEIVFDLALMPIMAGTPAVVALVASADIVVSQPDLLRIEPPTTEARKGCIGACSSQTVLVGT
jgi:hypothetical protein